MELALNLVCLLIAFGSVLAWTVSRRRSDSTLIPELRRGLLVIGCILMLIVPAISITDDLAQSPLLAEGVKLQDLLKAPEHLIQFLTVATLLLSFFALQRVILWRELPNSQGLSEKLLYWSPSIEKRPPPYPSF